MFLLTLIIAAPLQAGQLVWTPGGDAPTLIVSLGDGVVKKTLDLPSGATSLVLVLKKFLAEDAVIRVTWKSDGILWMRRTKKMPDDETTERMALPTGRSITLEITTLGGVPLAAITLRRK